MVRLEALGLSPQPVNHLFQFHYGTIRSHSQEFGEQPYVNFNSTMVRLEA